jgi:hypothetical protein
VKCQECYGNSLNRPGKVYNVHRDGFVIENQGKNVDMEEFDVNS